MDRWTDRRTNERMDRPTDGSTNGRTNGWTNGLTADFKWPIPLFSCQLNDYIILYRYLRMHLQISLLVSTQFFKFNFSQGSIVPMDVGLFRDYFYLNMRKLLFCIVKWRQMWWRVKKVIWNSDCLSEGIFINLIAI